MSIELVGAIAMAVVAVLVGFVDMAMTKRSRATERIVSTALAGDEELA
jgi:uncharacterized membrane protein